MFLGAGYKRDEVHEAIIECKEILYKLSQEISIISLMNPNSKQLQDLIFLSNRKKLLLKKLQKQYVKSLSINTSSIKFMHQLK